MQITSIVAEKLQSWIGIPLRMVTACWPFVTEALALLWWATSVDIGTLLKASVTIIAFGVLCFFPRRIVFSSVGLVCVFLIICGAAWSVAKNIVTVQPLAG